MRLLLFMPLLVLFGCGTAHEKTVPYAVKTPASPRQWERTAARELDEFLSRIAPDGRISVEGLEPVVFHVGETEFAQSKGLGTATFEDEEWCVRSFGRDVVLTGGGRRGALYAVYHFLEDDCDVRFWSDDDVEIPRAERLSFAKLNRRGRPHFRRRVIFRAVKGSERQAARCRMNGNGEEPIPAEFGGEGMVFGGPYHTHTWDRYLPFSRYGKNHPEWYSLVKGTRVGGQHKGQLCLTCPGLVEIFAAEVEKAVAKDIEAAKAGDTDMPVLYCLSPNDNHGYCECASCRAEIDRYGMSGYVLRFQNAVSGRVGACHPELRFTVSAYHETETLPKGGVVPAKNQIVKVCYTTGNLVTSPRDPENRTAADLVRDWGKLSELNFHEYGITFGFQYEGRPLPNEFSIVDRYRFYAENNVSGGLVELEGRECDDMYELKYYLTRRALEDPWVDSDALIGEFMRRYYGPAGEDVLAARKALYRACREKGGFVKYAPKLHDFDCYDDVVLAEAARLFDLAEARVETDGKRLARVRRARASVDRLIAFRKRMSALVAPEPEVSNVPFLDFPVDREMWCAYPRSEIRFMEDPEACNGLAIGVHVTEKNSKNFGLPFACGFSAEGNRLKRNVKIDRPAGQGYRWYELGEFDVPDREVLVWMTRTWQMQFKFRAPQFDGQRMRVRLHLKFSGPEFFPGKTGESVIAVDRIVFIPVKT